MSNLIQILCMMQMSQYDIHTESFIVCDVVNTMEVPERTGEQTKKLKTNC